MSGRAYNKEVTQWGYVALVCVALAFTTLTGAAANTKSAEMKLASDTEKWGACLTPMRVGENSDRQACESTASADAADGLNKIINSALVNAGLESNKSFYPLRDSCAY